MIYSHDLFIKTCFLLLIFLLCWRLISCFEIFHTELDNKEKIIQLNRERTLQQNKLQNYQIQKKFAHQRLVKLLNSLQVKANPNYIFAKIFDLAAYEGLKITFFSPYKKNKEGAFKYISIIFEANGHYETVNKFLLRLQNMLEPVIFSELSLTKTKKNIIHMHSVIDILLV